MIFFPFAAAIWGINCLHSVVESRKRDPPYLRYFLKHSEYEPSCDAEPKEFQSYFKPTEFFVRLTCCKQLHTWKSCLYWLVEIWFSSSRCCFWRVSFREEHRKWQWQPWEYQHSTLKYLTFFTLVPVCRRGRSWCGWASPGNLQNHRALFRHQNQPLAYVVPIQSESCQSALS